MLFPNEKVNNLLDVFSTPKSIEPYNNLKEKEEMNNARSFINNCHNFNSTTQFLSNKQVIDNINESNLLNSLITNKSLILNNPNDIDIKNSITNLRLGQKQFLKEQELNDKINNSLMNTRLFNKNNLFKNSNLYSPNINLINSHNRNLSMLNLNNNNTRLFNSKINISNKFYSPKGKIKSLKDIPSIPEDVIIKELPPKFSQINKPISSMKVNMVVNSPIKNNIKTKIEPVKEEIYSNITSSEETSQNNEREEQSNNLKIQEEENITIGKYKITALNCPIKVPNNYSTDDVDEYNAIQMINDDISTWKLQIEKPNYKIYYKPFKVIDEKGKENESRMFYLIATIDFPASEVNKQINTFELRKQWEGSLKKGKLIKKADLGNGIKIIDYYAYIKMNMFFSDRDIVVRKKIWENYFGEKDCCLNEIHSIELPDYPAQKKPVRAILLNKSKYIKPIDINRTKFYYVSKLDMKINASNSIMESKGAEGTEKWFKAFLNQLGK